MQQLSMWESKDYIRKEKSLAGKLMETRAIYNIAGDDNVSMELILTALLGNIPDETMTALMSMNMVDFLNMSKEELMAYPGVKSSMAARLMAAFALTKKLSKAVPSNHVVIRGPEDVYHWLKDEVKLLDREHFVAVLLNIKNQVIAKEVVSIGTLNSSMVHPRELFKRAIRRSAASIILVHNHPSGDPTPSREDITITKRLMEAGEIIGVQILDHIIIGFEQFVSLKAKGLI